MPIAEKKNIASGPQKGHGLSCVRAVAYAMDLVTQIQLLRQLLQPTPDALTDPTGVDAFCVRNFHGGHAQVEPGIDALACFSGRDITAAYNSSHCWFSSSSSSGVGTA